MPSLILRHLLHIIYADQGCNFVCFSPLFPGFVADGGSRRLGGVIMITQVRRDHGCIFWTDTLTTVIMGVYMEKVFIKKLHINIVFALSYPRCTSLIN